MGRSVGITIFSQVFCLECLMGWAHGTGYCNCLTYLGLFAFSGDCGELADGTASEVGRIVMNYEYLSYGLLWSTYLLPRFELAMGG